MLAFNQGLFLALNAPMHPPPWQTAGMVAIANSPVWIAPVLLAGLWIWGAQEGRAGLIATGIALFVAQGVNLGLGSLWFEPRPFMVPIGTTLMAHAADNGFPSDHATLVFTLGAGLVLTRAAPAWGLAAGAYGLLVAVSRVWLGVHFPIDMAASAVVGVAVGAGAGGITPTIRRRLLPRLVRAYDRALSAVRVPARIAPREEARPDLCRSV